MINHFRRTNFGRELAPFALILLGVCLSASPAVAQGAEKGDSSGAYVRVSREEVRVYFPPETSSAWGSSSRSRAGGIDLLRWHVSPEGVRGASYLSLTFRLDSGSSALPSLETVAREGRGNFCLAGMLSGRCSSAGVSASVENRRIVLSYRDTIEIRQLFGLRPATVLLLRNVPAPLGEPSFSDPPVHYVDPPLVVDSAQRVAIAKERRRREASVNRHGRVLAGGAYGRLLWMVAGDSVELRVQENECRVDVCSMNDYFDSGPNDWGRWSLSDSSLAELHGDEHGQARTFVALRPGRVLVRVMGVHTPTDTMPSSTPIDTILEREVVVTRPVGGVRISPRPTSMLAGAPMEFTVRALDRSGRTIEVAPVELRWDYNIRYATSSSEPVAVSFTQPGPHWIAASLGAYTDSVMVDVRPPRTRRRP